MKTNLFNRNKTHAPMPTDSQSLKAVMKAFEKEHRLSVGIMTILGTVLIGAVLWTIVNLIFALQIS
jgi:hypothetical protein